MNEHARDRDAPPILLSEYRSDPDMSELVGLFVEELDAKVEAFDAAWRDGNHDVLRTLAHQLKGSAGGYGFPTIGEAAAILELAVAAIVVDGPDPVRSALDRLSHLCLAAVEGRRAA